MGELWFMIIGLLFINVTSATKDPDWWKHTIVYQIYPRSFQDSDGDGVGDLKGIESRLDYIKDLGADTVWLSPIYTSPMADFGYDVADYKAIDPVFGSMDDFDDLLQAVHDKDMYLVMDFIPNHTSDQHPWFIESRKGGTDNPYKDYFRWSPGKITDDGTRAPPNNWLSIFGGSAWEWDEERQEYYLHQFVKEQPDLDYRNPKVIDEMKGVLHFWVDKGVDGFRVDAILTMFEVEDLSLDEPPSNEPGMLPDQHAYLLHPYTLNQPEIHDVVREWRELIEEYDVISGHHTFMVMEIYDPTQVESMKYYDSGSDMPFNFNLIFLNDTCGGTCTRSLVDNWLNATPEGKWSNFVLGNHDNLRITTRKAPVYANALNMLLLTLPGTPTTYYGEELALRDIEVSYEDTQDPYGINMGPDRYRTYSRDPARAPMQWCGCCQNAGFSTADKTWLPVNPDYTTRNVQAQKKDNTSPLEIYRKLATLRKKSAFRNTDITYVIVNDNIISFIRQDGESAYLLVLNLGNEPSTDYYVINGITTGVVVMDTGTFGGSLVDTEVDLSSLTLNPGDGLVIQLNVDGQRKDEL